MMAPGASPQRGDCWALSHGAGEARVPGRLDGTPWRVLSVLLLVLAAVASLRGRAPETLVTVTTAACLHGALLATALGWCGVERAPARQWIGVLLIAVGFAGAALGGAGALAHLLTPAWLTALARRGELARLGLGPRVPGLALAVGAALGIALAAHLVATAALTFGYGMRVGGADRLAADAAYDVAVNVLTAECFFRGALFDRLHRRWPLVLAALVTTAAGVLRYLADPRLSGATEVVVGAVFYLALLGLASCWLRWWAASLVPGMAAAVLFFTAYRLIGPR